MAISYVEIANSSYLDFSGYRITSETTVPAAYGFTGQQRIPTGEAFYTNVALVLPRANDPTDLLAGDWASRQEALKQLGDAGALWSTYGADPAQFAHTVQYLKDTLGLTILDAGNSNYVTSAESRTVWVQVATSAEFEKLFGTAQMEATNGDLSGYWNGNLSLPQELAVAGLWIDTSISPAGSNHVPGVSVPLSQGLQSQGNGAPYAKTPTIAAQDLGSDYSYAYPLDGASLPTKTIGLIEPGIGSALAGDPSGSDFQARLTKFLAATGQTGTGTLYVQGASGQEPTVYAERSLDVSVAAAVNPNSDLVLFVGSGVKSDGAQASTYTAIQSTVFPGTGIPKVSAWSDSFGDAQSMSPDSPFYRAYWELYVDTVLNNQTAVTALGDGGSSQEIGNGLTNLQYSCTQPFSLLVSGTSMSTLDMAQLDPTLTYVVTPALAGDKATIWQLVIGGLTTLPSGLAGPQFFVETVWNDYIVDGNVITGTEPLLGGYMQNGTSNGGVDPIQPVPNYQQAYGLLPTTTDPLAQTGRGAPDVSMLAGGNAAYQFASTNFTAYDWSGYGTSAAAPMWASLIVQIDTIFADQGLPDLGYAHDLLYMASAIAPASFNDVTIGNNISSFAFGGSTYTTQSYGGDMVNVIPTGYGYYAGPGYDLVTGLGSPNATVLARTLSAAAHSQMYFADQPAVVDGSLADGWTSGTAQSLLFQTMAGSGVDVGVTLGGGGFDYASGASDTYAWTSRLALQSLNPDFDPNLVTLFDKQAQGAEMQRYVAAGQSLGVAIDGVDAQAIQAGLTSSFGFADFMSSEGAVRVARPVAVAETAGGASDQQAVVRVRQNGEDSLSLTFYKVDDLAGTINGLQPGEAGYAAAAQGRAYQFAGGATSLAGPGYGNYAQAMLQNVDAGDVVAMTLVNQSSGTTYWAFAQANESVNGQSVGHLWNYGLNTWGWEDTRGGGDHDFNDLVVQLDFTSASGSGWLV
ncbi:MAG: hypothetical protein LCH93_06605 [Proteobacteria bacterium]|nr:hypothetical protein [Pseudomonadota bacterium]